RLAAAIEGVEQMSTIRRGDSPDVVPEPPPQLISLPTRTDLDPPAGRNRLNGVAQERVGNVAQRIEVGPGPGFSWLQLAREANSPGRTFLCDPHQACPQYV